MQIGCYWKFDPTWPLDDLSLISPWPYTLNIANYIFLWSLWPHESFDIHESSFEAFWNFDPHLTSAWPLWEGAKSSKILSKYFLTYNDFKTINNSFSSKRYLSTSSTTSSIVVILTSAKLRDWRHDVYSEHDITKASMYQFSFFFLH